MSDLLYRCPKEHVCLQDTYDELGYCPYCHLTSHARVINLERKRQKRVADKAVTRQSNKKE